MATSGSPPSVRDDAERIVKITTFTENALQEPQEPLLSQDEGDISVEHNEESGDVENQYTTFASSVKGKLDLLPTLYGKHCCIYRVPIKFRRNKEADFTPEVVSIGPLHHGKKNLQAMEEHKQKYLKEFLERINVSMEDFIAIIKKNEAELRDCYAEIIRMGSDEFVEMILVDATFIIELLLKDKEHSHLEFKNDCIFNRPWMAHDVMVDMLMLENQIPYFILEKLYDAANVKSPSIKEKGQLSIIALFYHSFKQFFPGKYDLDQLFLSKFMHFLDFFRIASQPERKENQMTIEPAETWTTTELGVGRERFDHVNRLILPSEFTHFLDNQPARKPNQMTIETRKKWTTTELEQAGVKFEALDLTKNNMFDIRLHDGILQIPKITFKGGTNVLLRNLVAFERCHCHTNFFGDYAIFLDLLIDTKKDIDILIQNGVLEAWASDSKEVAETFNRISSSCSFDNNNFSYAGVWKELDNYCKVPWHRWQAILRRNYLNTPWAIISLLAAAVLLLLTALQTLWSMTHP